LAGRALDRFNRRYKTPSVRHNALIRGTATAAAAAGEGYDGDGG